jgi:hypothetical protein
LTRPGIFIKEIPILSSERIYMKNKTARIQLKKGLGAKTK